MPKSAPPFLFLKWKCQTIFQSGWTSNADMVQFLLLFILAIQMVCNDNSFTYMILIHTSLMASDVRHFFICYLPSIYSLRVNVCAHICLILYPESFLFFFYKLCSLMFYIKSMIHFELIFVSGIRLSSRFFIIFIYLLIYFFGANGCPVASASFV